MGCSFIVSSSTQEDRWKRSFYHNRRRAEKKSEGKCWVVSVKPVRTRRTAHCCWSVVLCPILLPFIYRRLFSRAFLLDHNYQGYGDRFDSVYKGTKFLRPSSLALASQYIVTTKIYIYVTTTIISNLNWKSSRKWTSFALW